MTCIVGLEFEGRVLLGGDTVGTGNNCKMDHTQPKVFNKKGILFGYTTRYRFGQILEHNLADPVVPSDPYEIYRWLITVLVPDIKRALRANDYEDGGMCLLGIKNQLWLLKEDFGVLRPTNGYTSIGSGYEYAIGSIFSSTSTPPTTYEGAETVLRNAVLAAGTFCPSVGCYSTIIST